MTGLVQVFECDCGETWAADSADQVEPMLAAAISCKNCKRYLEKRQWQNRTVRTWSTWTKPPYPRSMRDSPTQSAWRAGVRSEDVMAQAESTWDDGSCGDTDCWCR